MAKTHLGLKAIAVLEAGKGILALLVGLELHHLGGQRLAQLFEQLLALLHLSVASPWPAMVDQQLRNLSGSNLTLIMVGTTAYASIRFVEAFGLWRAYLWTEWFALLSGAVYLPFEVYELATRQNLISLGALVINLLVIAYMYWVIRSDH
ncbi:DUF2127 domain-containing protein [Gallaecimonas sp. GXIMD1310]|uniref:DUF2127 domain-containing protein n=1 Tax=Gallaecimonas sp. GXIMD1310 TaxID=3131926 RepID=UPI003249A821